MFDMEGKRDLAKEANLPHLSRHLLKLWGGRILYIWVNHITCKIRYGMGKQNTCFLIPHIFKIYSYALDYSILISVSSGSDNNIMLHLILYQIIIKHW